MAREERNARAREPSENGEPNFDSLEVEARKRTTIADDLGNRASGRLKQDSGRQHEPAAHGDAAAGRAKRRARRFRDAREPSATDAGSESNAGLRDDTGGEREDGAQAFGADGEVIPDDRAADSIAARKETTLADDLGVESSGRLKQSTSRQHDGAKPDGGAPTRTRGKRYKKQSSRLRAQTDPETTVGDVAGKGDGNTGGSRLKASKGARHALRFAEDAGAIANAAVMEDGDRDASEDALDQAGRRMRPYGRRALDRARRRKGAAATVAAPSGIGTSSEPAAATPGSTRLRDGPALATKAGGKAATADKAAVNCYR